MGFWTLSSGIRCNSCIEKVRLERNNYDRNLNENFIPSRLAEILEEEYQGLLDNDPHCEFNGHVRLIFRKNFFFDTVFITV